MKHEITSFYFRWIDCGLGFAGDTRIKDISIYRRKRLMKLVHYNGYEEVVDSEQIKLSKEETEAFFEYLEAIIEILQPDYSVPVCDGFRWEMKLRDNSRKITKVIGTVGPPYGGRKLKLYINNMVNDAGGRLEPTLF